jgi:tetratricopeptide (TPR) repeat protein
LDGGLSDQKSRYNSFYGQSWLLFHYMVFAPERAGQLRKYQQLLGAGTPALDAAQGAFGDLDRLEQDMESYQERRRLAFWKIDRKDLTVGPIEVRSLSRGEAEIMPTVIRSRLGVTREEALAMLPEARRIAALYPREASVLAALAEAEYDAGNDDAAITAADLAAGIDPKRVDAHIQKGYALFHKAQEGERSAEAWKGVRSQFVKANKLENDNPIPLAEYYQTYLEQGVNPTPNAVSGLEWAMALAPFDASLRWMTAQQMVSEGRLKDAARTLGPLAFSPHPGELTQRATELLQRVESEINTAGPNGHPASDDDPAAN